MEYSNIHKTTFQAIKLPETFMEEDRGIDSCCCKFIVFGSADSDKYKNNKTSAWIVNSDTVRFYVVAPDGTEIDQTTQSFVKQTSAKYCTVDWSDILLSNGQGCYQIKIDYSVSGIEGTLTWGEYQLWDWNSEKRFGMVSFRTVFGGKQSLDGIDTGGSEVEDCLNLPGFFGNRQPKTVIDNVVYSDRSTNRIIRENVNEYTLTTDGVSECISKKLIDLHLLSENETFVSDYNVLNHSYNIYDKPVILSESANVDYVGRLAKITAKFEDKIKNSITVNSK